MSRYVVLVARHVEDANAMDLADHRRYVVLNGWVILSANG